MLRCDFSGSWGVDGEEQALGECLEVGVGSGRKQLQACISLDRSADRWCVCVFSVALCKLRW